MSDEKHRYERPESPPPIPSYEEATSSRHASARRGPNEVSDDAERQGLLSATTHTSSDSRRRNGYYQAPSVQSVDDGDSEPGSPISETQDDALRQTMEEMEILDPGSVEEGRARRQRSTSRFQKRIYSITSSFSSIHLPRIRWPERWRPDFRFFTQRMPTIPEEYKPGWSIIARLFGLILIISLVYLLVVSEVVPMGNGFGAQFNPEWVRQTALQSMEGWRIEKNLEYITSFDHLAGTKGSYILGQWIEGRFKDSLMDTYTHDQYSVHMNYPKEGGRRVAIVDPPELRWAARLEEPNTLNPPQPQTAAFHALSASGNVTGPLVYVNYCDAKEFKSLWDSQIDVQGTIALCRYGGTQPDLAMKVKAAQAAGCAGVLVYSDPSEDGFKKGPTWPDGQWRPKDSVQRGSVAQSNMILGDILTPGKASTSKQDRLYNLEAIAKIPSLPISWPDAQSLLKALQGKGEEVPGEWKGGVPDVGDVWYSGHPDTSPKVNLQNEQDETDKQKITNIFGTYKGIEDKARKIIIGNHRDSWCFGAADPGSGTAIMLEVARVFGELRAQGWRPLRTIEFASWDGGEYNKIGSTEHVEANIADLRDTAIAYLNIDVGVTGDQIWARGSPIFERAWTRALDRLNDPRRNTTLKELWEGDNKQIANPNAATDTAPFQFIAGTSSFDFGFSNSVVNGIPLNPMSGSCYETKAWMSKYVDADFQYHNVLAQIWILLILELAQEPIMPMKIDSFARHLQEEGQKLLDWSNSKATGDFDIEIFQPLVDSLSKFKTCADDFHRWETFWYNQVSATGGFETAGVTMQRVAHNMKLGHFEKGLLDLPTNDKDLRAHGVSPPTENDLYDIRY